MYTVNTSLKIDFGPLILQVDILKISIWSCVIEHVSAEEKSAWMLIALQVKWDQNQKIGVKIVKNVWEGCKQMTKNCEFSNNDWK